MIFWKKRQKTNVRNSSIHHNPPNICVELYTHIYLYIYIYIYIMSWGTYILSPFTYVIQMYSSLTIKRRKGMENNHTHWCWNITLPSESFCVFCAVNRALMKQTSLLHLHLCLGFLWKSGWESLLLPQMKLHLKKKVLFMKDIESP